MSTKTSTKASKKFKEPENFLVSIKEYRQLKRIIKAMETTNYDKIIVVTCDGKEGWRDIAEHSALIYYYAVRKKLNGQNKFMSDANSFYTRYDIGYMRTKGLNAVRDNLVKLGLYKSERAENKYIHIFELNRTFTQRELDGYYKQEIERRLKNSLPLDADVIDPKLWHQIAHLSTVLHTKTNHNLDKVTGKANGVRIITLADNLLKNYLRTSVTGENHDQTAIGYLEIMQTDLSELSLEIKVLSAIKQWDPELCVGLMDEVCTIKTSLEQNIAKLQSAITKQKPQPPEPPKPAPEQPEPPEQLNHLKQLTLGDILSDNTAQKGAKS